MLAKCINLTQIFIPEEITKHIGNSLVKAAGLEDWEKEGFMYPNIPGNFAKLSATAEERMATIRSLFGSIDDPTFVEPPEVVTPDAPRKWELLDL